MLRFLTAGESHGEAEVAILEGVPAGLILNTKDIQKELDKRRFGAGRGGRGKIEDDRVRILSGVRHGKTMGSPIALIVDNRDFANWKDIMSPEENISSSDKVTAPRPGHADLAGVLKYRFNDVRNVLERASARETIMRVAVGAIAKKFLSEFDIEIASHTIQIGDVKLAENTYVFEDIRNVFKKDPEIRCLDRVTSAKMREAILQAIKEKNTLGGVVEVIADNVPAGLGSYVHYDRKLDGIISSALMSIPSVKAVEIGNGIENAQLRGSEVHDRIYFDGHKYYRKTNNAGGVEGGISNGENIICRVYHKPISTLGNPLQTVDITSKENTAALIERSDVCVVPRAGVISEAMLAFCLAKAFLEKFGCDSMGEIKHNFAGYLQNLSTI